MSVKGIKKIAIVGTGAIGGYYGCKLAKAGVDVHFLARSDYQYIQSHGLKVASAKGQDISVDPVNVYNDSKDMPQCDLILITLKTTSNDQLNELLKPLLHEKSLLCSLQNGYGLEHYLSQVFPQASIIGGLCFICSQKVKPGIIDHQDFGSIRLADYNAGAERLSDVAELFTQAEVPTQTSDSLTKARWEKLVWNVPFNGLSVVLNAKTDAMLNKDSTRALIKEIMLEVIQVARVHAADIDNDFADKLIELTDGMAAYYPSMKVDYDLKRPMELKDIYQATLNAAYEKGIAMPKTEMLLELLTFMDHS
ncbi:putative 2-dehydropantoate 2-reductase [Litoribacillus peritrichatus]|uniref:2-dehydropantoate 2-reductase n=1 Tax=Litoribacillus peritrichatus TaxID=718191 RepID=A0ABP7MCZ6_9GAMM